MTNDAEQMHNQKARGYIEKAMNSRDAYDALSRKEADVWSRQLVNPRRKEIYEREQVAGQKLNVNEYSFRFLEWMTANKLHFEKGLSIGCGAGRAERKFIDLRVCDSFHGVDIAEGAVDDARRSAAEKGYNCTYECGDINFFDFGEARYDFAMAQTSLHHLLYLENVFAAVGRALKPGGVLFLTDYVGESQFQYSDLRISIVNSLLEKIPQEFCKNHLNNQTLKKLSRKEPGTLISPFESIRSGDILKVADSQFRNMDGSITNSILHLVCPVGTRANYLKNDESMALFQSIKLIDRILIQQGVLSGTNASLVYKKI